MSYGRSAMVVEDDPSLRQLFKTQLKHMGFEVVCVSDAAKALKFFESGLQLELLLTDVVLPGDMNGQQLSEHVKRTSPHTVTLFTSGYPAAILARMGVAGVEESLLIQKPFRLADLKSALDHAA
jgi:CheY-like chemotaxis protein